MLSPVEQAYNSLLQENKLDLDENQKKLVSRLGDFYRNIEGDLNQSFLKKLFSSKAQNAISGIYIWGGVGRGKSCMMDIFYTSFDLDISKTRIHFHNFMINVHDRMNYHRNLKPDYDIIDKVAQEISQKNRLLCFDELQISNIADAMIISRLFKALLKYKVYFVITSNRPPEDLYKNGIHRDRILPFIEEVKQI